MSKHLPVQVIFAGLSQAARKGPIPAQMGVADQLVMAASADVADMAIGHLMGLVGKRQQQHLFRFLANGHWSPNQGQVKDVLGEIIKYFQNASIDADLKIFLAFEGLAYSQHVAWATSVLEPLLGSAKSTLTIWSMALEWRVDVLYNAQFQQILLKTLPPRPTAEQVVVLARLLAEIEVFTSASDTLLDLHVYLRENAKLLPLGHAADVLKVADSDAIEFPAMGLPLLGLFFERSLASVDPGHDNGNKAISTACIPSSEAKQDMDSVLQFWAKDVCRRSKASEMHLLMTGLERAMGAYSLEVADVLTKFLIRGTLEVLQDAEGVWARLEAIVLRLEDADFAIVAAVLFNCWPSAYWSDAIGAKSLSWLTGYGAKLNLETEPSFIREPEALDRALLVTPVEELRRAISLMRPSSARTRYLERLIFCRGPIVGLDDATRLKLSQHPSGRMRQLAITMPGLEAPLESSYTKPKPNRSMAPVSHK